MRLYTIRNKGFKIKSCVLLRRERVIDGKAIKASSVRSGLRTYEKPRMLTSSHEPPIMRGGLLPSNAKKEEGEGFVPLAARPASPLSMVSFANGYALFRAS